MTLFPMSCVLRGLTSSTYISTPRRKPLPAIASRSGEAGGLVRLVEHINEKNQDVKSRRLALLIEKIVHFQIGNEFVTGLITGMGTM
jgi:hypothetical protein